MSSNSRKEITLSDLFMKIQIIENELQEIKDRLPGRKPVSDLLQINKQADAFIEKARKRGLL